MKFLIILGILVLVAVAYKKDFKCDTPYTLKANDCNFCLCTKNGSLPLCTKGNKCDSEKYKRLKSCLVGRYWKKQCNRCWCVENFGTICEWRSCKKKGYGPKLTLRGQIRNKGIAKSLLVN